MINIARYLVAAALTVATAGCAGIDTMDLPPFARDVIAAIRGYPDNPEIRGFAESAPGPQPVPLAVARAQYPAKQGTWIEAETRSASDTATTLAGGAALGATAGAVATAPLIAGCLATGPFAPIACATVLTIVGIGSIFGAAMAADATATSRFETPDETETPWAGKLDGLQAQAGLFRQVQARLREDGKFAPIPLPHAGPKSPEDEPDYSTMSTAGAESLLEVGVVSIDPVAAGIEHTFSVRISAQARLIRLVDGEEVASRDYEVLGDPRPATQWTAMDAEALASELERIYEKAAAIIVADLAPFRDSPAR